jgi:ElaB/YqjD/DUF883 family membrane-anchored ribosome-binding protein
MLASNIKTVRNDMRALMRDAQELFREAANATGGKADELRAKGMELLEAATAKAVAHDTDQFVKDNPWKAVAISAGVGLLIGMLIARK